MYILQTFIDFFHLALGHSKVDLLNGNRCWSQVYFTATNKGPFTSDLIHGLRPSSLIWFFEWPVGLRTLFLIHKAISPWTLAGIRWITHEFPDSFFHDAEIPMFVHFKCSSWGYAVLDFTLGIGGLMG